MVVLREGVVVVLLRFYNGDGGRLRLGGVWLGMAFFHGRKRGWPVVDVCVLGEGERERGMSSRRHYSWWGSGCTAQGS